MWISISSISLVMHHGVDHYSYMTGMRMVAADLLELEKWQRL